jgi:hypothetical protein
MTEDAFTDLGVSWLRGLGSVSPFCSKDMMAKMTRRHSARSSSVIDSCTQGHCCMTKEILAFSERRQQKSYDGQNYGVQVRMHFKQHFNYENVILDTFQNVFC